MELALRGGTLGQVVRSTRRLHRKRAVSHQARGRGWEEREMEQERFAIRRRNLTNPVLGGFSL
jgi:hypothetical protein